MKKIAFLTSIVLLTFFGIFSDDAAAQTTDNAQADVTINVLMPRSIENSSNLDVQIVPNVDSALQLVVDGDGEVTTGDETAFSLNSPAEFTVAWAEGEDVTINITNADVVFDGGNITFSNFTAPGTVSIPAGQRTETFAIGYTLDIASANDINTDITATQTGAITVQATFQ